MIYRIITSPPGYAVSQRYMIGKYKDMSLDSLCEIVVNTEGSRFFASLEDAYMMIPKEAKRIAFDPKDQFVELWSVDQ